MSKTIAAIDGSILAYKASAACEDRFIRVLHKPSGREKIFKNRTTFKSEVDLQQFSERDFEIEDDRNVEPIEYCLNTAKKMVESIVENTEADSFEIWLDSDKPNFRETLPFPQPYKGHRVGIKPYYLNDVKQYLKGKFKAKECFGIENDDMLVIRQYQSLSGEEPARVIACTTDKDNMQTGPGTWLYNFDKMEKPFCMPKSEPLGKLWLDSGKPRGYGFLWLAYQIIYGDKVDNLNPRFISGDRFGEKAAYNALKGLDSKKKIVSKITELYKKWYPVPVQYIDQNSEEVTMSWEDMLNLYGSGAYMLRSENDRFDYKRLLDE